MLIGPFLWEKSVGEIILSQVGASVGSALLPNGISIYGQTLSGAVLGQSLGALAGRAIDASMLSPQQGPRIESLQIMESREGAGLPKVFGRMRTAGQVIWASRFKEKSSERSAGKGGPRYTEYTYSVSFAVALCEGIISRIDRVWANGELINLGDYNWRLYRGDADQLPDPLIEAIEGAQNAPAYRDTAYVVFEDLPLDLFGNRLPQLSFEVIRSGDVDKGELARAVRGVNIIPASGEFVYATSIVRSRRFPGIESALNQNNAHGEPDFVRSIQQLKTDLPNVDAAALTVGWFGDDLRAGECAIRPGVEQRDRSTVPYAWTVDQSDRDAAYLISRTGESPNYGGTPADRAVLEGIAALKAEGIAVTLSPFLFLDLPPGNGRADPYGSEEQSPFPWRGRITVSADKTDAARAEIDAFVGSDRGFGFRHFILHHARLAARAGGVDAILIGSEMAQLIRIRDANGRFPFVEALIEIAREVRAIVGPDVKISYAADWTEYGAYVPDDGSGDVLFPLDQLWASPDIDFIGVDWYPPASDWRDEGDHLDAGAGAIDSDDYIRANLEGGEGYDWYYESLSARDAQIRTPIIDTAHGEDWIFRPKDIGGWWQNPHFERPNGRRADEPTAWEPGSKPIRMIEIGFPAVDKGTNAPNVFYDPKSSESAFPAYSRGARDDLLQRRALAVAVPYWSDKPFMDQVLVWAWDARPWPEFPARRDLWSDGPNWQFGHWLNGRSGLMELSEVLGDLAADAEVELDTRLVNGVVDGYRIDGVTRLSAAISPLIAAYNLIVREGEAGLIAADEVTLVQVDLSIKDPVEDGEVSTIALLDKQPAGVSLSYISGDFSYEPAQATQRFDRPDRRFIVQTSLPLVLTEAHANIIAKNQYDRLQTSDTLQLTLGPGEASLIDVADVVSWRDTSLRVERIEDNGLQRQLHLRELSGPPMAVRALNPPTGIAALPKSSTPEFVLIDGPVLFEAEPAGFYIAVAADPWRPGVPVRVGETLTALQTVATVDRSAGLGTLLVSVGAGSVGRWDFANRLEVELPGQTVASETLSSVLFGANKVLVEHEAGWELIAFQAAELIADDRWHLHGLLRGLAGTPVRPLPQQARIVLVDDRLINLPASNEWLGLSLFWQVGDAEPQMFVYRDIASKPWRVGHLRVCPTSEGLRISWTARGRAYNNNWDLSDDPVEHVYRVEILRAGKVNSQFESSELSLFVPADVGDEVRVAEIGLHQQLGEWVSIPLPPP